MGFNNAPTFRANGTIAPRRFVKIDTTADHMLLQSGAGEEIIGISQEGMKRTPGLSGSDNAVAAEAGDILHIYSIGDVCSLEVGAAVTRGAWLMADANGKGITGTGVNRCGAIALESGGADGAIILVQIAFRHFTAGT